MRGSFAERCSTELALVLMFASTMLTVSVLLVILVYVAYEGSSYLNWSFLTSLPTPVGEGGGGIANALVGSLEVVAVASSMAIPIGVGAAIFLNEFHSGWLGWFVRFLADTLIGVPAIVVGLVAYAMVVQPMGGFSAILGLGGLRVHHDPDHPYHRSGSPSLVPGSIREASLALGIPAWKTILRIVLPSCSRALLTGLLLAFARALGEAAPMLFTAFGNPFWNVNLAKADRDRAAGHLPLRHRSLRRLARSGLGGLAHIGVGRSLAQAR